MTKDVKVIITAPVHLQKEALAAFEHAYHNSQFYDGFAIVEMGWACREYAVIKNKGGYSVKQVNQTNTKEGTHHE